MKKWYFFVSLFITISFLACDDNTPNQNDKQKIIQKIILESELNHPIEFTYDEYNRVVAINGFLGSESEMNISYLKNQIDFSGKLMMNVYGETSLVCINFTISANLHKSGYIKSATTVLNKEGLYDNQTSNHIVEYENDFLNSITYDSFHSIPADLSCVWENDNMILFTDLLKKSDTHIEYGIQYKNSSNLDINWLIRAFTHGFSVEGWTLGVLGFYGKQTKLLPIKATVIADNSWDPYIEEYNYEYNLDDNGDVIDCHIKQKREYNGSIQNYKDVKFRIEYQP